MKIIKKGNIYKKANWFQENEQDIYIVLCTIVAAVVSL